MKLKPLPPIESRCSLNNPAPSARATPTSSVKAQETAKCCARSRRPRIVGTPSTARRCLRSLSDSTLRHRAAVRGLPRRIVESSRLIPSAPKRQAPACRPASAGPPRPRCGHNGRSTRRRSAGTGAWLPAQSSAAAGRLPGPPASRPPPPVAPLRRAAAENLWRRRLTGRENQTSQPRRANKVPAHGCCLRGYRGEVSLAIIARSCPPVKASAPANRAGVSSI